MNLKPINKGILIEEIPEPERETIGGILVTKSQEERWYRRGKVIATDDEAIKVGQEILFNIYGPQRVNISPNQFIAKIVDVLAICE